MNATASGDGPIVPTPARIQKASLDGDVLLVELFAQQKRWALLGPGTLAVVDSRPTFLAAKTPPAAQGLLRKEVVPSTLTAARNLPPTTELVMTRPDGKERVLIVERLAADPRVVLLAVTDVGRRVLAVLVGAARAKDGRDLRRGQLYLPPKAGPELSAQAAPSQDATASQADPVAALRARLKSEERRLKKLVSALRGDLAKHGDAERHERHGELFKTVMAQVPRGAASIDVVDFDGTPLTLTLDPARDAKANLKRLFDRAKKARTALARVKPRLAAAESQLAAVAGLVLAPAPDAASVAQVEAVLRSDAARPSQRRTVAKAARPGERRKAWRSFVIARDVVVRVGRGAKDNDALVRDARGNDLWLHAREKQGAHVVVPSRGEDIPDDVLRDAAQLAAHFSSARGETRVEVQHTRVKHLKKPGPGAPAGLVHVTHESVVVLRVDAERLAALLAREVPA